MKSSRGFTVIELLIVVAVLALASVIFFIQKQNIETANRDDARRTSINAIYYSLEEVYKDENGSYPRTVSAEILPSVDPALFEDPNGIEIGLGESDFRYEPTNCNENACSGYTLRSTLEQEDDYVKTNRKDS
jgi:prepilin-type N-terminal cleavage/methylation domain-containing protein